MHEKITSRDILQNILQRHIIFETFTWNLQLPLELLKFYAYDFGLIIL